MTMGLHLLVLQQVLDTSYEAPRMLPEEVTLHSEVSMHPWVLKPLKPEMEGKAGGGKDGDQWKTADKMLLILILVLLENTPAPISIFVKFYFLK